MNDNLITYLKKEKEKFDQSTINKKEIHTQDVGTVSDHTITPVIDIPKKEVIKPVVVVADPVIVVEQKPKTVLWM